MAGTAMDEKWSIDKLDSSNWITWKFQMRHLLLAKGLWGYVDGTEVLREDASAQERADFKKASQKAFSTIVMAISTSQLYLVTSFDEPKDAWGALRDHYERDTLADKLMLKKQYFRTEMMEGTSIEAHMKHIKELTDKLAAIGAPISEEDKVVTLLGSLPKSYSTLVTALEARENVSLSYVQQSLIHEEQKLNGELNLQPVDSRRNAGQNTSALIGRLNGKGQFKKPRCYNCGEIGHFRRRCPKKQEGHGTKANHQARPAEVKDSESEEPGAFAAMVRSPEMAKWILDSGATSHMTQMRELLTDYQELERPEIVKLGDGHVVEAVGVGNVYLNMIFDDSKPKRSIMYQVLYVPKLSCNLFSIRAAVARGNTVKFGTSKCWIQDSKGIIRGMGSLVGKLYQLGSEPVVQEQVSVASDADSCTNNLWHQRLGHVNEQLLQEMVNKELAKGVTISKSAKLSFCEGCIEGKMHRKPFKAVREILSKRKLQCVHSDVCGPMPKESIGGKKYFVTFIDDYSRCCQVYFMRHKSEVLDKFKEFEAATTNDSGESIGTLRSDNGGEYLSNELEEYLKSKGIHHELTVPHSPEQNGVAERMNRTLMETARSMIAHAGLPDCYWAEAVATAVYLRNCLPTTALNKKMTPYERWYGRKPDLSHLKVFGCIAYAHIPDVKRTKLDKKAEKLRFVGYSTQSKGYRLLDENTSKVVIRRDVVFNEADFGHKGVVEVQQQKSVEFDSNFEGHLRSRDIEPELERSEQCRRYPERQRCPPVRFGIDEYADTVMTGCLGENQVNELSTIEEALIGYADADWAGDHDDRHSTTGNLFLMSGGAISWLSKKQPSVALSTAEAEYMALSTATQEAVWLRRMLADLQANPKDPTVMLEDNNGAIAIAKNPVSHARTKHIDIRYHCVRESVQDGIINLTYCPTKEMAADLLTKPLPRGRFESLRMKMGLVSTTAQSVN